MTSYRHGDYPPVQQQLRERSQTSGRSVQQSHEEVVSGSEQHALGNELPSQDSLHVDWPGVPSAQSPHPQLRESLAQSELQDRAGRARQ